MMSKIDSLPHCLGWLFPLGLLGADARATEFVGNHLFVSDPANHVIRELDSTGAVVRLLGGTTLVNPQRIAFGCDGNLYVLDDQGGFSTTDHLVVISPDGDVLSNLAFVGAGTFDAATAPAPYFTARGTLLVVDTEEAIVLEVEIATATVLTTYTDASMIEAGSVRVTERGQLHVGVQDPAVSVVAFEPDGFFVRALASPSLGASSTVPLLIDGNHGHQYLLLRSTLAPTVAQLHRLTAGGASLAQFDLANGPYQDLAIGPDGALWLLGAGGNQLVRVDSELTGVTPVAFSPAPTAAAGFAFAPFRLRLKAKGSSQLTGAQPQNLPSTSYELAYFPGGHRIGFDLEVGSPPDTVFGAPQFVIHGATADEDDPVARRGQFSFDSIDDGASIVASSYLRVTGSVNATTGYFRPKSAKGTLQLATAAGLFKAEIESVKVLQ